MNQISPAAYIISTEISIRDQKFTIKTFERFVDFQEKTISLKINPKVDYEFYDNTGEKVKLVPESYQEFLSCSDGYYNYLFGNLDPDQPVIIVETVKKEITNKWKCNVCQNATNQPSMDRCSICKTKRPNS